MTHWIYGKYQELANEIRKGSTLKTDAWQEHKNDGTFIQADYYVEILPNVVTKAKSLGFNVIEGTILNLPFEDNTFDTLIDTSTIDHVLNFKDVLKEYKRVLKEDGSILITVWTTHLPTRSEEQDAAGGTQYIFNNKELEEELDKYFTITKKELLWDFTTTRQLIGYIGTNKHDNNSKRKE
jgi:ubiquinone/menaquinone biosynthesis C-methylase UbiE